MWMVVAGRASGVKKNEKMGRLMAVDCWLVQMEWHSPRLLVCLPLVLLPSTIKTGRSYLLALAHPGGPRERAVKWWWWWWVLWNGCRVSQVLDSNRWHRHWTVAAHEEPRCQRLLFSFSQLMFLCFTLNPQPVVVSQWHSQELFLGQAKLRGLGYGSPPLGPWAKPQKLTTLP